MRDCRSKCKFNRSSEYYERSLISGNTLEEISEKHEELLENPFYDDRQKAELINALFQESNVNSARLEADLMKTRDTHKNHSGKICRKKVEQASREIGLRVNDAWKTGLNMYDGNIDENFILEIGYLVDPISNKEKRVRNISASVGHGISAVSPESLSTIRTIPGHEGHLNRFIREVNGDFVFFNRKSDVFESITPVEKAVYTHFMNFYLQPNMDGNKRTGRILQNLILNDVGLPPPVIHSTENREYTDLLVDAFKARRERDGNPLNNVLISRPEHDFYEYMGEKVLVSLDNVKDKLDSQKTYYINITSPSNNDKLYYAAKSSLASLMKRRDSDGFVKHLQKDNCLLVRGNVASEEISAVIDSNNCIKNFKISNKKPMD